MHYLIIINLFLLISNEDSEEKIHIINIKQGITKHTIGKGKTETIQFKAINDGYYLITFDSYGLIIEATGVIHKDTVINRTEIWRTSAYVQNFKKGDYFTMIYPYIPNAIGREHTFKIENLDSEIDIKLLTRYKLEFFENLYLTDCLRPTYIIIRNPLINVDINNNLFYIKSIIHSGEFYGSYLITDYSPKNNGTLSNLSNEFNLTELTVLPNNFYFNVIKLKCKTPGILTFLFNGEGPQESSSPSSYTVLPFEKEGVVQNRFNSSHSITLIPNNLGIYYLEIFNIHGCASFNTASLGGKTYKCTDFYLSTEFTKEGPSKSLYMEIKNSPFWFFSKFHRHIEDEFILEEEKKDYLCDEGRKRIIIPINSEKQGIKIKSSIPQFFWSLEFTQNNTSYLPVPSGSSLNYVYGDYVYIRNPNSFTQNKTTNYNWYIIVYHYNKTEYSYFSYKYTDEENDKDDNKDKSFVQNPIFWVIIILIIIIVCVVGFLVYYKFIRKPSPSKDNLLNDKELNKIIEE